MELRLVCFALAHRYGIKISVDCFMQWLVAWRHQAITWSKFDLSLLRTSDIHLRPISQEVPQPSITKISSNITYLKYQ